MRLINTSLFTPHNLLFIAAVTVITHVVAKPLYTAIDSKIGK